MSNREMDARSALSAEDVRVGFHPDGYRIDRTASAMNRYTRWCIGADGVWADPRPVCFHDLPATGWITAEAFDWSAHTATAGEEG